MEVAAALPQLCFLNSVEPAGTAIPPALPRLQAAPPPRPQAVSPSSFKFPASDEPLPRRHTRPGCSTVHTGVREFVAQSMTIWARTNW